MPRNYDLSADGSRFIIVASTDEAAGRLLEPTVQVVLNWFEELKQRAPVK